MSERTTHAGFWLAAAWLSLLALWVLGIALFGEPDDGVWDTRTWVEKAVEAAVSLLAVAGVVMLALRARASRWTAVPPLLLFGILSAWSALTGVITKLGGTSGEWSPTTEIWLNAVLALTSTGCAVFILRPATWRALESEPKA